MKLTTVALMTSLVCLPNVATSQESFDGFRTIIADAVKEADSRNSIYLKGEGDNLHFLDRDLEMLNGRDLPANMLYAIRTQYCVELFRNSATTAQAKDAIAKAEQFASQMLTSPAVDANQAQRNYLTVRNELLSQVALAKGHKASKEGFTRSDIIKQQVGEVFSYLVEANAQFPNKNVYYLSVFEYFVLDRLGRSGGATAWYQMTNGKARLAGTYRFAAVSGESLRVTGKVKVDKNMTLTLSTENTTPANGK